MIPAATVTFGATPEDITCLVESATIRHGRDDPTSQPEADAATFEIWGPIPAGVDIGTSLRIDAVLAGLTYPRFAGEITDMAVSWETVDHPVAQIIAVSPLGRMGHRQIGSTAYPLELDGARVNRAIVAAAVPTDAARTDPGTVNVTARTIDPQPALNIAHDAAEDGAGILWQAKGGAVLYADSEHRRAAAIDLELDACVIPLDVTWTKSLEGLVNDIRVTYGADDTSTEGGGDTGGGGFGDGGCCGPRETVSYTTADLVPGAVENATLTLTPSHRLMTIETSCPARFRSYTTTAKRAADAARPIGTDPEQESDHGLMLEYVTGAGLLSADLSPTVDAFESGPSPSGIIPIAITNTDTAAGTVTVTLTWMRTEA